MGGVALVVGAELDRRPHDLVVALVALHHVDRHGDRLLALVGDDDALAHLRAARPVLGREIGLARRRRLALLSALGLLLLAVGPALLGQRGPPLAPLRLALLGGA